MAKIAKMEIQTEIKCSADSYYDIFRCKSHLIPKICPNLVKDIQVLSGDRKQWIYVAGNSETIQTAEYLDEENKSITYNVIGGEVAKYYNLFKSTAQVTPKGDHGSLVKWTIEYEKANEEVPAPNKYYDYVVNLTKSIEAHLLNA